MAQLNDYIGYDGTNNGKPNQPVTPQDPNGIFNITPQNERGHHNLQPAPPSNNETNRGAGAPDVAETRSRPPPPPSPPGTAVSAHTPDQTARPDHVTAQPRPAPSAHNTTLHQRPHRHAQTAQSGHQQPERRAEADARDVPLPEG